MKFEELKNKKGNLWLKQKSRPLQVKVLDIDANKNLLIQDLEKKTTVLIPTGTYLDLEIEAAKK